MPDTSNRDSGFTPGPWRQGQDGNLRVYGPDGMGEHSGLIAVVYKGRGNARLIAAAPDLFEALADLDRELLFDKPVTGTAANAFTKARAALAKARGL